MILNQALMKLIRYILRLFYNSFFYAKIINGDNNEN